MAQLLVTGLLRLPIPLGLRLFFRLCQRLLVAMQLGPLVRDLAAKVGHGSLI